MFASKVDLRTLPPTEDSIDHHVLRSLYHILMYKQGHLSQVEFGRELKSDKLVPVLMKRSPRPENEGRIEAPDSEED